jgi:hypothetical protein
MEQYGEVLAGAGIIVYIVIGLFVVLFAWWGYRLFKGQGKQSGSGALSYDDSSERKSEGEKELTNGDKEILGKGNIKCLCFRWRKGVPSADFTVMENPIGEMYQQDPSCPIIGSGYIVKENEKKEIIDYDPREVKYKIEESPERAWFAINWDIVKQVFFVPVQWWKSTSVWFAAAMLVIVFVASLAVLG